MTRASPLITLDNSVQMPVLGLGVLTGMPLNAPRTRSHAR